MKEKTLRFGPQHKKRDQRCRKKKIEGGQPRFSFFFHFGFGVSVFDTLNKKEDVWVDQSLIELTLFTTGTFI